MVTREDALVWAMKILPVGQPADSVLKAAEMIFAWVNTDTERELVEDAGLATECERVRGERDRARVTAVRLEQELSEAERQLAEVHARLSVEEKHLIRGVLFYVRSHWKASEPGADMLLRAVESAATEFGVEL